MAGPDQAVVRVTLALPPGVPVASAREWARQMVLDAVAERLEGVRQELARLGDLGAPPPALELVELEAAPAQ